MDWIYLARDRDKWLVLLNVVLKLWCLCQLRFVNKDSAAWNSFVYMVLFIA